jgi:hypothetical protein
MSDEYVDRLINAYLDEALTADEQGELETLLKESEAARQRFWQLAEVHGLAGDAAKGAWTEHNAEHERGHALADSSVDLSESTADKLTASRLPRFLASPLATAVVGLVLGIVSTTAILAATLSPPKLYTIFAEDFEQATAPLADSHPLTAGIWSGDYSELSGATQEVTPESGTTMLRYLRADYEGRHLPDSFSSDVFHLIDVREHRSAFAAGDAVVQLSAKFNAVPFPDDEIYKCTLTIFALDESGNESLRDKTSISKASLAYSRSGRLLMDRDPATWQRLSNEMRVPPETQYLMIRLGMSNDTDTTEKRRDSFTGHFVDSVKLVFGHRPEIASR